MFLVKVVYLLKGCKNLFSHIEKKYWNSVGVHDITLKDFTSSEISSPCTKINSRARLSNAAGSLIAMLEDSEDRCV